jgi:hypothetical protein
VFFISPAPQRHERCNSTDFSLLQFKSKRYRAGRGNACDDCATKSFGQRAAFFLQSSARRSSACVAPPRVDVGLLQSDFAALI